MNRCVLTSLVLASLAAGTAALAAQAPSSTTAAPTAPSQAPAGAPPTAPASTCPEVATALTALMRNDARLADWPALGRYREANRALPAAAAGDQRVVFMGDSITDAWQQPRFRSSRASLRRSRHQRPDHAADAGAVPPDVIDLSRRRS